MKKLNECKVGTYTVHHIDAGRVATHRLISMGIHPNTEIIIKSNNIHLPLILEVKHTQISLGRGLAEKVFVE